MDFNASEIYKNELFEGAVWAGHSSQSQEDTDEAYGWEHPKKEPWGWSELCLFNYFKGFYFLYLFYFYLYFSCETLMDCTMYVQKTSQIYPKYVR